MTTLLWEVESRNDSPGPTLNPRHTALADRLQMPIAALDRLVQNLSANTHIKGQELADSFRNAVIDFRFLEDRWNRVHPPQIDLEIKTQALNALSAGDIDRAWALVRGFAAAPATTGTPRGGEPLS